MSAELHPRLVVADPDAAIRFYTEHLGAELVERFTAGSVVVHAGLRVQGCIFSLTQGVSDWQLDAPGSGSPVLMHLTIDDPDALGQAMVAGGAEVIIPIEDRPYGKREGRLRDPQGHLWILSCAIEDLDAETIQKRLDG